MESKANYTIVGIAVVVLLFGLITVALWLSEGFDRKTYQDYVVYMQEAVTGLSEGSLVKYNGVKVGLVDSFSLSANPKLVTLRLKIEEGTPITVGTVASLIPQGITGTTILGLSVTSADVTPLKALPGQPYPVIRYMPSFFNKIETAINELSRNLTGFMSKENAANFKLTLQEMPKLMGELTATVTQLKTTSQDVSIASQQFSKTMLAGENVLNEVLQSTLPPTSSLVNHLDGLTNNFSQLTDELKTNPAMLIWVAAHIKKARERESDDKIL